MSDNIRTRRLGSNTFFGVDPTTKGVHINNSSPPLISLAQGANLTRMLSTTGRVVNVLDDPFYSGQDLFMGYVDVVGNTGIFAVDELITISVDNHRDHVVSLVPDADMVYHWENEAGETYQGKSIQILAKEGVEFWSVIGISPTYGSTVTTNFDVITLADALPIPRIQTLTNEVGKNSRYAVLNADSYDVSECVLEWRLYNTSEVLYETACDEVSHSFPNDIGIAFYEVRAKSESKGTTAWGLVKEITTSNPMTIVNSFANFGRVDPLTKAPYTSTLSALGANEKIHLKLTIVGISSGGTTQEIEIEVLGCTNGGIAQKGVYSNGDVLEIKTSSQSASYTLGIEYLIRLKGTAGGVRKVAQYTVTSANVDLYDFDVDVPQYVEHGAEVKLTISSKNVLPLGKYTYTMTGFFPFSEDVIETPVHRDLISIDSHVGPALTSSQSGNMIFTFYNILGEVVKTITKYVAVISSVNTHVSVSTGDLSQLGDKVTRPYSCAILLKVPERVESTGLSFNESTMKVYDVSNPSDIEKMNNKIGEYAFTGSEEYPHEYYPQDTLEDNVFRGINLYSHIYALDNFDIDLNKVGSDIHSISVKVTRNQLSEEALHQTVSRIPNVSSDKCVLLWDENGLNTEYIHNSLINDFLATVVASYSNTNIRAYLAGPNLECLIVGELTNDTLSHGRTLIDYKVDGDYRTLTLDPDNNVDDSDVYETIPLDAVTDFRVRALSLNGTATLTGI